MSFTICSFVLKKWEGKWSIIYRLKIELKLSFVYQCIDSSRNYETKVEGYKKLMEEVLGK